MCYIVLRNCSLIDVVRESVVKNVVIVVKDSKIYSVGAEGNVEIPKDAEIIDVDGKYVMPGLIDAHSHLFGLKTDNVISELLMVHPQLRTLRAAEDAKALLMAGFTTVRDAGSLEALYVRDAIREGTIIGPRIVASAYIITQTFGHGDLLHSLPVSWADVRSSHRGFTLICDGVDECRKAARYALRDGADYLKITTTGGVLSQRDKPDFVQFTLEEVKAIVEEAKHAKTFVASHAQGTEGINLALEAGVKTIEHAIYPDATSIRLAKEKNAIFIITYTIMKRIAERGEKAGYPPWAVKKAREVMEEYRETIKRVDAENVKIGVGTDFFGTPMTKMGTNAEELKLLVEDVGLKPMKVIKAATIVNAEACGLQDEIGSIEEGKIADIVVVNGNPLENISVLTDPNNIVLVMKEGKIVKNIMRK